MFTALLLTPGLFLGCKVEIGETVGTETSDPTASTTNSTASTTASTTNSTANSTASTTETTTTETGSTSGGELECGGPGSNSELIGNECFCDVGYDWCSPDPDDFNCCAVDTDTDATESEGSTGTSTGGMSCDLEGPPESCDPNSELAYCTSTEEECLGESEYFTCSDDGSWEPADGGEDCLFLGYDFSYGCVDSGDLIEQICGSGPGTACGDEPDSCADADVLNYCLYGKLGALSCLEQCQLVGDDMGVQYDFGSCGEQRGASPASAATSTSPAAANRARAQRTSRASRSLSAQRSSPLRRVRPRGRRW